ncbi:MAG: hypothetical protein OWQ56_09610 [Acidithiobacillus caldus]|nr:hypothetical protein [Acidithiobacillus caldus]
MITDRFLDDERSLPSVEPMERVVAWSVFRSREAARDLLEHAHLAAGQQLVGGHARDSIGPYWWVGVQVNDLDQWGSRGAINKRGRLGD